MNEYRFDEIEVGMEVSFEYQLNQDKMRKFLEITEDNNPLHTNLEYAKENGFPENVVYGQLTAAALSTLAGVYMPGKYSFIHSIETKFLKPVLLSQCPLKVVGKVIEKEERFQYITLKFEIFNMKNEKVCKGKMEIGVL